MMAILSQASGPQGMVAGQVLDIFSLNQTMTSAKLTQLYQLKTGALLTASIKLGLACLTEKQTDASLSLERYAEYIGLAFQIQDDLLDIESSTETLGKPQGLDIINDKSTFPALFGVEKTKEKIQTLFDKALHSIEPLGQRADILHQLAHYLLRRKQ
jgi:geranylgeranyl pyrophosphate synthase